jgi:hypothetical protein
MAQTARAAARSNGKAMSSAHPYPVHFVGAALRFVASRL